MAMCLRSNSFPKTRTFHGSAPSSASSISLAGSTDTGYLTDYDMGEEYRQLYLAGLSFLDILAMLTTSPSQRFHVAGREGRIVPGMNGDLTILSSDPVSGGAAAFTQVLCTIRNGRILFGRH